MDIVQTSITEIFLFFLIFIITFKAVMRLELAKYFQKGAIWQIQVIYVFLSIALAYLVTSALMNLIRLMSIIFL
ncbi:MAG: DUF1146 family protein [Candidatus Izemoplasmataceae bacterium]|jgi:uncharacterized membrane protein YwzB|uniref:DUF1146 family protein n=1 Tax=Liberiplasma polymorphum TaxID=3374570 RepID=UPI003775121E